MKMSFIKRSISLILILTFFCGSVFPMPFALASEGASAVKPSITGSIINLLSSGFSAGSSECMAVFNEYKKAVSEYTLFRNANTVQESAR